MGNSFCMQLPSNFYCNLKISGEYVRSHHHKKDVDIPHLQDEIINKSGVQYDK